MTAAEGILLLHSRGLVTAATVAESTDAFSSYSRFPVWTVNTYFGFPPGLNRCRFKVIVLHYSLFYDAFSPLDERFLEFLAARRDSYLVAMFQDEQAYLPERLEFCDRHGVDCVYTHVDPPHAQRLYGADGSRTVVTYLPGYVSERLCAASPRFSLPEDRRPIDIGYRGRKPPADWGDVAQEKYEIGVRFRRHAQEHDLRVDIEMDEDKRIYGQAWYRFIGSCKAVLGTESGTGALPWLLGGPRSDGARALKSAAGALAGAGWEPIPYRTIAPRHFEAAGLRSCQILYEGSYSGVLEPMVHYIPLKKDFSNFDQVVARYRDAALRRALITNAYRDLIAGDRYTYARLIAAFDRRLEEAGAAPRPRRAERLRVAQIVRRPYVRRAAHIAKKRTAAYMEHAWSGR